MTCRCGRPATQEGKCDRCAYYDTVVAPNEPISFESRKDVALRAIRVKKMMKQGLFRMVIE